MTRKSSSNKRRHALTDEQWHLVEPLLPRSTARTGRPPSDPRLMLDGIFWILATGAPWRDLPERFGPWHNVYNRFSRWARRGHWKRIYKALRVRVDKTGSIVDGSNVRAHQDAAGGKGGSSEIVWVVVEADSRRNSI